VKASVTSCDDTLARDSARQRNLAIAQRLLADIQSGVDANDIANLFAENARCEVPGDVGVLPWVGHRTGRAAVAGFIVDNRSHTDVLSFRIEDVLASESRAVAIGELASRIVATDKVVESAFAIVLSIIDGQIERFQMIEDSFAVSRAACS
jgi:ketosteroid isomerase-like protein